MSDELKEKPVLKVENICKSFGKEEVLKSVSFELNKGEVLADVNASVELKVIN